MMRIPSMLRISTAAVVVILLALSGQAVLAAGKVDLNTADAKALEALPGVGPATAKAIIAARPFKSVDDLKKVKGIGEGAKFNALKNSVTVGASAPPATASGTAAKAAPAAAAKAAPAAAAAAPAAAAAAPAAKAAAPKAAEKAAPSGPVDLNTADMKGLEALPGVGPATAKAIIAARPFKSVDDLKKVKGIGEGARFAALKDKVTVGRAPVAPAAPAPAAKAAPAAPPAQAAAPAAPAAAAPAAAAPAAPAAAPKAPAKAAAPKLAPGQKVNLNTASKDQLDMLPGIGPVKAQAIIDARPFKTIEDVMKVKGIKQGEFAKIKDLITVN